MRVGRRSPIGAGGEGTENLRLEILTLARICQQDGLAREPGEDGLNRRDQLTAFLLGTMNVQTVRLSRWLGVSQAVRENVGSYQRDDVIAKLDASRETIHLAAFV